MSASRRRSRVIETLQAERRTLKQGSSALAISTIAGFIAGLILSRLTDTLQELPGLIVLIPAAVGMRGTIFGAVGARLGTSIHAGLFETSLRSGGVLRRNASVAVVTTFTSSVWLAALTRLVAPAFGGSTISFWQLVTISVVSGILGSVILLSFTISLSRVSFRRAWDLDSVGTPLVTALGDVVTLPTLYLATLLVRNPAVTAITASVCLAATAACVVAARRSSDRFLRRTIWQMTGVIALTPLLDIAAGALLHAEQASLLAQPGLLILIPPFVSQAGALGGILSSRLSSKLQLGVIRPSARPDPPAVVDAALVSVFGIGIFLVVGIGGTLLAELTTVSHPGAGVMIAGTLLAGLALVPAIIAIAYVVAASSTRLNLEPDDQSVPVITSAMDLLGVGSMIIVMSLLGVLGSRA
jgi:mgtE-like transporter